jgi:hypothetical protein
MVIDSAWAIAPASTTPSGLDGRISAAAAGLDAWFETMHGPGGYGGPVAHWWQQSFVHTGAGLDWRYEGIIAGYLTLWERTGDERWLHQACRAGDDLIAGQLGSGHYAASAFELNPATAGTPHEAACDAGLLLLALTLRRAGRSGWEAYRACAERNLHAFYVKQLWNPEIRCIADAPHSAAFVPNKAATACEALFLLTEIGADGEWAERYAAPTLERIVEHQVRDGTLDGAIAQNSFGAHHVAKYFPIYMARCIPALLCGYRWTNDERYLASAWHAMAFIIRHVASDGSIPAVVYPGGQTSRGPSWLAPLGDVLLAADELRFYGFTADLGQSLELLLAGQDESGGIQTARGFAAQAGGTAAGLPDVRDLLHVAGWCDKAFRFLASHVGPEMPVVASAPFEADCTFRGQPMHLRETPQVLEVACRGRVCYRWRKGESWAEIATPEFWLR